MKTATSLNAPMFGFFLEPKFMPCEDCGASVAREDRPAHVCEQEQRLDYTMFQLRDGISAFDGDLADYLTSPRGKFEAYDAERRRPPLQES